MAKTYKCNVSSVNETPEGTDNSKTIDEDASYTFATVDFGFSDPIDAPASRLAAVDSTTLATVCSFRLNGVAVTLGQEILATDIASGNLKFFGDLNENGTPYGSFTLDRKSVG